MLRTRTATLASSVAALVAITVLMMPGPAQAVTYYHVGYPMFFNPNNHSTNYCTGAYAVRGSSGMFIVTAGHCSINPSTGRGITGAVVYGTDTRFGRIIRNDRVGDFYTTNTFDGALVQLDPGHDAYQIVVDPRTGRRPGDGRVRGWYANSALTQGFRIGKMGNTSGWTEGTITGWQDVVYPNGWRDYLLCTTVPVQGGDSGGPVWRLDGNGVMAIGIVIARLGSSGTMCFNPIQNVLNRFGASLPVFTAASSNVGSSMAGQPLVITEPNGKPLPVNHNPVPATLL